MAKNLRLAQVAATATGQATLFNAETAHSFTEFVNADGGDLDCLEVYHTI